MKIVIVVKHMGVDYIDALLKITGVSGNTITEQSLKDMKLGPLKMHMQDIVFQMGDAKGLSLEATIFPMRGTQGILETIMIKECTVSGEFSEHDQNAIPSLQALAGEILREYEYPIKNRSFRQCEKCGSFSFGTMAVGGSMVFSPHTCPDLRIPRQFGPSDVGDGC